MVHEVAASLSKLTADLLRILCDLALHWGRWKERGGDGALSKALEVRDGKKKVTGDSGGVKRGCEMMVNHGESGWWFGHVWNIFDFSNGNDPPTCGSADDHLEPPSKSRLRQAAVRGSACSAPGGPELSVGEGGCGCPGGSL